MNRLSRLRIRCKLHLGSRLRASSDIFERFVTNDAANSGQSSPVKYIRSVGAREKMVQRNLDRMIAFSDSSFKTASAMEVRGALEYWVSSETEYLLERQGRVNLCTQNAQKLIEFVVKSGDPQLAQDTLFDTSKVSINFFFIRLMQLFLAPIQSTYQALAKGSRVSSRTATTQEWFESLGKASAAADLMSSVHDDDRFPLLVPDRHSRSTILNLWSKRCIFLSRVWNRAVKGMVPPEYIHALGGALNARECIDVMQAIMQQTETPEPCDYTFLLNSIASMRGVGIGDETKSIIQKLESTPGTEIAIEAYIQAIVAYSNEAIDNHSKIAADKALELFRYTQSFKDVPFLSHKVSYSIMMKMYSRLLRPEDAENLLLELDAAARNESEFPTNVHYNIILDAWARSPPSAEKGRKAENILQRMMELSSSGRKTVTPDTVSFTSAIYALLSSTRRGDLERALNLLSFCENSEIQSQAPDMIMMHSVLKGMCTRLHTEVEPQFRELIASQMDEVLKRHIQRCRRPMDDRDLRLFHFCFTAWASSHASVAGKRAIKLLQSVESVGLSPTFQTFELVMKSLAVRPGNESIDMADKLIIQMESSGFQRTPELVVSYLRILCKSQDPSIVRKAHDIINGFVDHENKCIRDLVRSPQVYNILIDGYSRLTNAAKEADEIFSLMKTVGVSPSIGTYNALMEAWGKSNDPRALDRVEALFQELQQAGLLPTSYSYGCVQNAWNRSGRPEAPEKVESLLGQMQSCYESGQNPNCQPDSHSFSLAINCWAQSRRPGAPQRCEAIIDRMKQLQQTTKYTHLKPSVTCYKGAILAWALSKAPNAPEAALDILNKMDEECERELVAVRPDSSCYRYVIVAISKSERPDIAQRSYEVFQRMVNSFKNGNRHARPSSKDYLSVIGSCRTFVNDWDTKAEVYAIAAKVFKQYLSECPERLWHEVLSAYLKAAYYLLPAGKSRDETVESVLKLCPRSLLALPHVKDALHEVLSPASVARVLGRSSAQR